MEYNKGNNYHLQLGPTVLQLSAPELHASYFEAKKDRQLLLPWDFKVHEREIPENLHILLQSTAGMAEGF